MFNIHSQVLSLALSCTYGWGERGSSIYFGDFSGYTCSSLTGTCEFYYSGIYCTFFSLFHGTFFLDQFLLGFFSKSFTDTCIISWKKKRIAIVTYSPAWAKSTCYSLIDHDPWPFHQLCFWILGGPGLSLALLNQGAQNKTDSISYGLGVSGTAGMTKCSPTWARISCLSSELWKGECFMSLIYSGSLGTCPNIAICFFAQSILSCTHD